MADEIRANLSVQIINGNFEFSKSKSFTADQATARGGNPGSVTIGSTEEVISLGDITTEGMAWIENLDVTNFIDYGPTSGGSMVTFGRIKAGEGQLIRLFPGVVMRAKSTAATGTASVSCDAYIAVMED